MALIATRLQNLILLYQIPAAAGLFNQESPFLSIKYNVRLAKILQAEDTASDLLRDLDDQRQILQMKLLELWSKALMVLYNQDDISVYGKGGRFGHVSDDFGFEAAVQISKTRIMACRFLMNICWKWT